jgi:NADH-quinone oxidoreductase subunit N
VITVQDFVQPSFELDAVVPMLVAFGAGVVAVLVDAFAPARRRAAINLVLSVLAMVVALGWTLGQIGGLPLTTFNGAVVIDGPALFAQAAIALFTLLSVLLYSERRLDPSGDPFTPSGAVTPGSEMERVLTVTKVQQTEVYPLTLFASAGMMMFVASNDLLTMFVALEVLSLPLYLLSSLARRKRLLSQEAGMKYFLLGAFASAFFLYGASLVYGATGSLNLAGIDAGISGRVGVDSLLLVGMGMLAVGMLFKISAVPFQFWTPDVYQGAPTPVTGFMAAATKAAAVVALMRLFYVGLGGLVDDWSLLLWVIAAVTMLLGSLLALTQTDVKRMLAYSSVAHAGFLLVGIVAADAQGTAAVLFYLLAYGVATVGAFAVVTLVRDAGGEATHLSQWAGLGRRSPLLAGVFALFLLSFAGIPLTSGFVAKLTVFSAAFDAGQAVLVLIGLLASAIAAFFYVRVIVLMFFSDPVEGGATVGVPSAGTTAVITAAALVTVLLGIVPGPVLELAELASEFVR